MISTQTPIGAEVWFLEGAFVRQGKIVAAAGPQVCIRAANRLYLRVRKDLFASEPDAIAQHLAQLIDQIAVLEVSRVNALHRLTAAQRFKSESPVPSPQSPVPT